MTNRNKRRVAVAVAAILGATASASLYARYADQPIWPEREAPRGAMCLELKDSAVNKELKAKYGHAVEARKQAQADLAAKQEAVEAQRKLLLQVQEQQQQLAADCATAVSQQQQAEWAADKEARRKAAELAQREALEAAQKRQAEWQAAVTAQQQATRQAQQKAAEEAQKRQAEWQAAMTAEQQAARQAQQKAAEEAQKRQAEWQTPWQERNEAAMAQGQTGAPFGAVGYPGVNFPAPFEAPGPLVHGDLPGMDWDYLPERPGFLDAGYADTRKELFEAHQRRRDEMKHRRFAKNERLDTSRRDGPYRATRYYETSDYSLAERCEALNAERD